MAKSKHAKRYPKEFHRQMVELHRGGRTLSELSREFGCSQWAISRWVKQADRDEGRGDGGLTTEERQELVQLRREVKRLKMEREILGEPDPMTQAGLDPNTGQPFGLNEPDPATTDQPPATE